MEKRFVVKFTRKAHHEYERLDTTIIGDVNRALETLEYRADIVGKRLGKKRTINLTGAKEKKLQSTGIRIIYHITDRKVEVLKIVEVLLVDFKQNEMDLYRDAQERLSYERVHGAMSDAQLELFWNFESTREGPSLDKPSMIDQIFDDRFDDLEPSVQQKIIEFYSHGDIALHIIFGWKLEVLNRTSNFSRKEERVSLSYDRFKEGNHRFVIREKINTYV